jgi:hypothetical protein
VNTNNVTSLIPGLNLLPPKWQNIVAIAILVSPYITRAIYALRNEGGIKGMAASIWLGTNTPKPPTS